MLPPPEECRKLISAFDCRCASSTFDEFWTYKLKAGREGSILDLAHLSTTSALLDTKLLRRPEWMLWQTGIPPAQEIQRILGSISDDFDILKDVVLGQGRISRDKRACDALQLVYDKLCGITHRRWGDLPNSEGKSYLVGKAKVLMFIWGQTPAFDRILTASLSLRAFPHLRVYESRYSASEFRDMLKTLDEWVAAWEKEHRQQFQDLDHNRPIGRIIDIVFWV